MKSWIAGTLQKIEAATGSVLNKADAVAENNYRPWTSTDEDITRFQKIALASSALIGAVGLASAALLQSSPTDNPYGIAVGMAAIAVGGAFIGPSVGFGALAAVAVVQLIAQSSIESVHEFAAKSLETAGLGDKLARRREESQQFSMAGMDSVSVPVGPKA